MAKGGFEFERILEKISNKELLDKIKSREIEGLYSLLHIKQLVV
jgi:hypothetical protein